MKRSINLVTAILSLAFFLILFSSASAQSITPFPTPTPPTRQYVCENSPECYWENPNCICANGKTPIPTANIKWNEVQGYKGASYNADPQTTDTKPASASGNIFKNVKPAQAAEQTTQTQTATPVPTPSAPPFDLINSSSPESTVVQIESVKTVTTAVTGSPQTDLKISGTGPANSYVYLYIFSDPIVVTVKTDQNGNWSYLLEKRLDQGDHKIYAVTETDNQSFMRGKILTFKIVPPVEAESKSGGEYSVLVSSPTQSIYRNYLVTAIIVIIVAVGLILILFKSHKARTSLTV